MVSESSIDKGWFRLTSQVNPEYRFTIDSRLTYNPCPQRLEWFGWIEPFVRGGRFRLY